MSSCSSAPKRLLEEVNSTITSKRSVEEGGVLLNSPGKPSQLSIFPSNESLEPGLDERAAKLQRTEALDVDKRSSPLPLNPTSSSANGSSDHLASNDVPEIREDKSDSKEKETNSRTLSSDPSVNKVVTDLTQDINGEDNLLRPDCQSHSGLKSESRLEKEGVRLKESKEHHRPKRLSEAPREGAEEVRKEVLIGAERETLEGQEDVAENRVDLKDKEKKKKDEKLREGDEREKDKSDHRASLKPIGKSSKDSAREERETEKWEKERKDLHRDKERKDKERDNIRRETLNMSEEDCLSNEKKTVKVSNKIPDQDGTTSEPKKSHHQDVPKDVDRDLKDKKRDREPNPEVDRNEKRRHLEKESEDGTAEGANEREKEAFSYGIQQRKRMLRPRASHSSNREARLRARARENDGSQGEASLLNCSGTIWVSECMLEILKSWKEFVVSPDWEINCGIQSCPTLEIRIPAEHVTATNRQVRGGQLWGTDVYTDDSDLVAVLMHTGYCRPTASLPPPSIQELRATIRILPPQTCYYSTLRNNVRSRAWGAGIRCSYRVEKCSILKKGGGTVDLEPCLTLISAVEPTLAPVSVERFMTTRSAASNALRQQKFVREVTVQYNLCNEPWVKYSINFVADKGLKKPLYTSARLKKGEVIYLETHLKRYELCYIGEKSLCNGVAAFQATESEQEKPHQQQSSQGQSIEKSQERGKVNDVFRWSLCKKPLPQEVMRSVGIPLPIDHLEVLEENLEWEEVQWSQTGVWVAGKEYSLARVHFLLPS